MTALSFNSGFWNISNPQDTSAAWQVGADGSLSARITGTDIVQADPNTTVAGYPYVQYGQSAFGGPSTVTAPGLQLPASVASLQAATPIWLAASYTVDNSANAIPMNVAYDMFITADPATDVATESPKTLGGGLEVMIWTDRENGLAPAGGGAGFIEQVTLPASINGAPVTDVAFNVYVGQGAAGPMLTTFALADPISSGSVSVDLSAALADLALPEIASADGVSGAAIGADYLDAISLGTEFGPGTGTETFGWTLSALSIAGDPIIGAGAPTLKGETFTDGTAEVAGQLKLKNGQISADSLTIDNGAIVEAKGGAGAQSLIGTPIVDNSGLIEAMGGDLVLRNAQVNNASGEIWAGAGATVTLQGSTVDGGVVETAAGGAIAVTGFGVTLRGVTNEGALVIHDNTGVTLAGAFENDGTIALEAVGDNAKLVIANDLTLDGAVTLSNSKFNVITGTAGAVTLTNEGSITGAGQVGNGELTLVNGATGVISGTGTWALQINSGGATIVNQGTIAATGVVIISSPLDNTGKLKVAGGAMTVNDAVTGAGAIVLDGGTLTFAASFDGDVKIKSGGGLLIFAQSQAYAGVISGFPAAGGSGSRLDLEDVAWDSGAAKVSYNALTGLLTVTNGAETANIELAGDYTGATFQATSDGRGGTYVSTKAPAQGAAGMAQAMAALGDGGAMAVSSAPSGPAEASAMAGLAVVPRSAFGLTSPY